LRLAKALLNALGALFFLDRQEHPAGGALDLDPIFALAGAFVALLVPLVATCDTAGPYFAPLISIVVLDFHSGGNLQDPGPLIEEVTNTTRGSTPARIQRRPGNRLLRDGLLRF
jgi:hypothetical protein